MNSLRLIPALALAAACLASTVTAADPPPAHPHPKPKPIVAVQPHINTLPGVAIAPSFANSPFSPGYNPYSPNPFNPYAPNLFVNPTFPQPALLPFARNPFLPGINPPFAVNPLFVNAAPLGVFPFTPVVPFAPPVPPIAIQQPGQFLYRGPNLAVNPASGAIYRPATGVVVQRDGSVFYRVPGTGVPDGFGSAQLGTETFYNPLNGTYFNPQSGVVSRPGTNGFTPWIY